MSFDPAKVANLVDEYTSVLHETKAVDPTGDAVNWATVVGALVAEAEWTREGALAVATLAKEYGSFVLRNALALALALDLEDGELGL